MTSSNECIKESATDMESSNNSIAEDIQTYEERINETEKALIEKVNEISAKDDKLKEYEYKTKEYINNISELENEINHLKKQINIEKQANKNKADHSSDTMQINFDSFEKDSFINSISETDILSLNPMEAMNMLYKLVGEAKKLIK